MRTTRIIKLIVALWIVFVTAFFWALGSVTVARADTAPAMRTFLAIAADYWHVDRGTPVGIAWDGSLCPADTDRFTNIACASHGVIYIRPNRWDVLMNVTRCTIVVHEYGHAVIGLDHVEDPRSIMNQAPPAPKTCERYAYPPRKGARYV